MLSAPQLELDLWNVEGATGAAAGETVEDLFAGPGGWSCAAQRLGLVERGYEWDAMACATARAAGHLREQVDVRTLRGRRVSPARGMIGSPPCQTFTLAGKGTGRNSLAELCDAVKWVAAGYTPEEAIMKTGASIEDERSLLVLEPMVRIVTVNPEWITLEQVPTVLPIWEAYAEELRARGYSVDTGVLSAEQYGVPQTRRRAILVANRTRPVHLPRATHSRYYASDPTRIDPDTLKWVSMAEALGWGMTHRPYPALAPGSTAGGPDQAFIGGSGGRKIIRNEMFAGRWVGSDGYGRHPEAWVGSDPDAPALPTVSPGSGRVPARPGAIRLTIDEAGILQSFPKGYPWQGRRGQQARQVGDAIPPLLAQAVIRAARGMC